MFAMQCYSDINQMLHLGFGDKVPIKYYAYTKLFNDGTRIYLSNIQDWLKYFLENFVHDGLTSAHFSCYSNDYLICHNHLPFYMQMRNFNLGSLLFISERHEDYSEIYVFSSSLKDSQEMTRHYFEAKSLFKHFTFYFKEKAEHLIKQANKDRYLIPKCSIQIPEILAYEFSQQKKYKMTHQQLITDLHIKHYPINHKGNLIYLTQREYECALELAKGITNKEIGKKLAISFRTVEFHIGKIREKIGTFTRQEIRSCLLENNLI